MDVEYGLLIFLRYSNLFRENFLALKMFPYIMGFAFFYYVNKLTLPDVKKEIKLS